MTIKLQFSSSLLLGTRQQSYKGVEARAAGCIPQDQDGSPAVDPIISSIICMRQPAGGGPP
jgi:hypothetical protein